MFSLGDRVCYQHLPLKAPPHPHAAAQLCLSATPGWQPAVWGCVYSVEISRHCVLAPALSPEGG